MEVMRPNNTKTPLSSLKFTQNNVSEIDTIEANLLLRGKDLVELMSKAARKRDARLAKVGRPGVITFSKKVFIPVTTLCRDRCHYCTFVNTPHQAQRKNTPLYMSEEQVISVALQGARIGCKEALFTLGDRPEDRWPEAQQWLDVHGFQSTLDYIQHLAKRVMEETGLLPHLNPGVLSEEEFLKLRHVAPSMGMMLETTSRELWNTPGKAHYGSPDKNPEVRLKVIEDSGKAAVPFTTGILVGIGESIRDRAESLYELRRYSEAYGNLQEVIIQNFRAKPATAMRGAPDAEWQEYLATVATARLTLGHEVSIQAPPNLADPENVSELLSAGIDDWGGISPLTPDHVNPERPWPSIQTLAERTFDTGYLLRERLTAHPEYVKTADKWMESEVIPFVLRLADQQSGLAIKEMPAPIVGGNMASNWNAHVSTEHHLLKKAEADRTTLSDKDFATLLELEGEHLNKLAEIADESRRNHVGEVVTFVANRSVLLNKYSLHQFGKTEGWGRDELIELAAEIQERGNTEICLQGVAAGQIPYLVQREVLEVITHHAPDLHIHAFRAAELIAGAKSHDVSLRTYLEDLRELGLRSIPGTGVSIPSTKVKNTSSSTPITLDSWGKAISLAHRAGLHSTAVAAFGNGETSLERIAYLRQIADIQDLTGGFSEFIPLPAGLDIRPLVPNRSVEDENIAMTAVSRLYFQGKIRNIQAAWPRIGQDITVSLLRSGANDLGGTLDSGEVFPEINSFPIQGFPPAGLAELARKAGRSIRQRSTLYEIAKAHV